MAMSKDKAGYRGEGEPAARDDVAAARIPWVVAFLTETQWDDGSPRKVGSILVTAEEGHFKAWVHDRAGRRSGWLSGDGLLDLLASVERALAGNSMPWRSESPSKGR